MSGDSSHRPSGLRLSLVIGLAGLLGTFAPLYALLVGPLLFGVPHLIGDFRVLWLGKPGGFGGRIAQCVAGALIAMTGLRVSKLLGWPMPIEAEIACGVAAIAIAAIGGAANRSARIAWSIGVGILGMISILRARETLLVLAHAHNLVAIALWLAWSPRRNAAIGVIASYIGAALFVIFFPVDGVGVARIGDFEGARVARELAPGLSSSFAEVLVRTFAFAQMVHYGIWSWNLPGHSSRSIWQDFGRPGLWLCVLACILVPVLGLVAPTLTRSTYLQLAIAHGWFELAVLAYLVSRGNSTPSS